MSGATGGDDTAGRLREVWRQVEGVEKSSADIAERARALRTAKSARRSLSSQPESSEVRGVLGGESASITGAVLARDDDPVSALGEFGVRVPGMSVRLRTVLGTSVWAGSVDGAQSGAELWAAVRDCYPRTGWWPVLMEAGVWDRVESVAAMPNTELDGADWLSAEWDRRTRDRVARDDEPTLGVTTSTPEGFQPLDDRWQEQWAIAARGGRRSYGEIALIAAPNPWLVPALLGWTGAINYQIGGREHAAVLRHWATQWGAEPLAFGSDRMRLRVLRPPRSLADASTLALQGWLYCPDTFEGGQYGEIPIARSATSSLLSFWWD